MRFLIVLLAVVAVLVSSKDLRQQHECPAYECDASTGSGCKHGYTCLPINCGDVCVLNTSESDGDEP
ncbi:hypothetical protein BsWGS_06367 [Bradybaena similaris]